MNNYNKLTHQNKCPRRLLVIQKLLRSDATAGDSNSCYQVYNLAKASRDKRPIFLKFI